MWEQACHSNLTTAQTRIQNLQKKPTCWARTRSMHPPSQPFIEGAERVTTLKVLAVHPNARFTMTDHVSQVLNPCSSSMFAWRLLRTHGLQPQELHLVARATTVAS